MTIPPHCSLFHHRFLTGDIPVLALDDEFLRNHTKVLLISDASDKIWKVKLNGNRLAGGWEEFAAVHRFRDGDVLVFRHDGDEIFHVAASPRSDSCNIRHHASPPSFVDTDDDAETDDDYSESDDDEEECDDDDAGDILVNKNKKREAGFSCFLRARVTPYSLIKDRLDLSKDFTVVSFNKPCEIELANEKGRKWTLLLSKNTSSGVFYIRRGWVNFCSANGLSQGDLCKFKLSENGERPVLRLCPQESGYSHEEVEEEECLEVEAVKIGSVGGCSKEKRTLKKNTPSKFLTIKLTPNRLQTGQLYISSVFVNESGIKKSGEITLMNQDGRKWPSYLQMTGQCGSEWFYLRHGWREMCRANGVKVNDSFVLELVLEDANPVLKFCSKVDNKGNGNGRPCKKRACEAPRVETEGLKRGRPRLSNRDATNSTNLQSTQQESCSVSDQVAKVKQSILDTLNTVRQFRAELEAREKNLEASLQEVDALGKRILGISQILNSNLV
ncbi:B3 domain-containing protein REM1 [Hirschfeldia incana]|nr:B3 domain-containing protein REM1 [Hirschfeldia incana]